MARINIEECWWSDPRRTKLLLKIGFQADAAAVNMWRIAQGFWADGRMLIPKHIFYNIEFAEDLLGVCLAELRGELVYVRGSSAFLDWAAEKRAAAKAGGRKSAERPRNAKGQLQKTPKQSPSKTQAESKLIQASDSDSDSDSDSSSSSAVIAILEKSPISPVGVYVSCYQEKYGHRPEVGPREGKILKTFSENHPDRWEELVRGYLNMPDSWAVARSHPVEVLVAKVNEIGRFLATGKVVTKKVIEHAEEIIDKAQGTNRRPRRPIAELEQEQAAMRAEAQLQIVGGKP